MEIHKKIWGHEKWIVNEYYCGKELFIKKQHRCSLHYHKNKDETFYVINGKILIEYEDGNKKAQKSILSKGDSLRIKPNITHRFTGIEDSLMIEFSTHHEDSDSYRISVSEKMIKGLFDKVARL